MFVMGEVTGVLNSFSSLHQTQSFATRRFAGKSWGHLDYLPPIQHYLRHESVILPLANIAPPVDNKMMFGSVEEDITL